MAAVPGVVTGFGLAYLFSDQVERLLADVRRVEAWLVVAAVLLVAGWWLWTTSRRRPSWPPGPARALEPLRFV